MNSPEKPEPRPEGNSPPVLAPGKTTIMDREVDTNLATALCYVPFAPVNLVAAVLVFMAKSDNNRYARFHAVQSGLLAVGVLIFMAICQNVLIPFLSAVSFNLLAVPLNLIFMLFCLAYLVFGARLALDCYRGKDTKLPFISPWAEEFSK